MLWNLLSLLKIVMLLFLSGNKITMCIFIIKLNMSNQYERDQKWTRDQRLLFVLVKGGLSDIIESVKGTT